MGKFRGIDSEPGWIKRDLRDLQRQIRELGAAKGLGFSTIDKGALKVTRAGAIDIEGEGALNVNGNLTLRPGIIENGALANPVAAGYAYLTATAFPLGNLGAHVIDETVLVPEGFTSCVVTVTGRVFAYNSTALPDHLYTQAKVNGLSGSALPVYVDAVSSADNSGIASSPFSTVLTGLSPGLTFPLQLWAATATGTWLADPTNTAELTGSIIWF